MRASPRRAGYHRAAMNCARRRVLAYLYQLEGHRRGRIGRDQPERRSSVVHSVPQHSCQAPLGELDKREALLDMNRRTDKACRSTSMTADFTEVSSTVQLRSRNPVCAGSAGGSLAPSMRSTTRHSKPLPGPQADLPPGRAG